MGSMVSRPPAADSARALRHFESLLEFETDCRDVHPAVFIVLALIMLATAIVLLIIGRARLQKLIG